MPAVIRGGKEGHLKMDTVMFYFGHNNGED